MNPKGFRSAALMTVMCAITVAAAGLTQAAARRESSTWECTATPTAFPPHASSAAVSSVLFL